VVGWLTNPHTTVFPDVDALLLEYEHYGAMDIRWLDPDLDDNESVPETSSCMCAP
jgi:hypothetical protein